MAPLRPEPPSAVDRSEAMVEEKSLRQVANKSILQPALQSQSARDNGHRKNVFQSDTPSSPAPAQLSEATPGARFEQTSPKLAMAPLRPELSSAVDRPQALVEEKVINQIVNKTVLLNASRDEAQAVDATG